MSYSRLIHDYLDGGLAEAQKEALFAELASNHEIRQEFDRQVSINNIARMDMNSIAPPLETTNALFASLGFSFPTETPEIAQPVTSRWNSRYAAFLGLIKKHYPVISAAILASAVTAIMLSIFSTDSAEGENQNYAANSGRNAIPLISSWANDDNSASDESALNNNTVNNFSDITNGSTGFMGGTPSSRNSWSSSENGNNTRNSNSIAGSSANASNRNANRDNRIFKATNNETLENEGNSIALITPAENQNQIIASADHSDEFIESIRNRSLSGNSGFGTPIATTPGYEPYLNSPEALRINPYIDNTKIFLQVRGFSMNSNVEFDGSSQGNMLTDNFAIGAFFRLDGNWSLMLETGKEAFPMEFTSVIDGRSGLQTQNPERFWLGTGIRYTTDDLGLSSEIMLSPYAQAFAAYSSLGPVLRGQTGLAIRYRGVSFNVGYELSSLIYNVDGTIYNTRKTGLTYGINYHF